MIRVHNRVQVPVPISEVFTFLAEASNERLWRSECMRISPMVGTVDGTSYHQTLRGPGGIPVKADFRVTLAQAPHLYQFEVIAGPVRPHGEFALERSANRMTVVTFSLSLMPGRFANLFTPILRRQLQRDVDSIHNLPAALTAR